MASRVERTRQGQRETSKVLLEADNTAIYPANDGGLIVELFRYGKNGQASESYRFHFSPEDKKQLGIQVQRRSANER